MRDLERCQINGRAGCYMEKLGNKWFFKTTNKIAKSKELCDDRRNITYTPTELEDVATK